MAQQTQLKKAQIIILLNWVMVTLTPPDLQEDLAALQRENSLLHTDLLESRELIAALRKEMKDLLEKLNSTNSEDRHVRDMLVQVLYYFLSPLYAFTTFYHIYPLFTFTISYHYAIPVLVRLHLFVLPLCGEKGERHNYVHNRNSETLSVLVCGGG